MIPRPETADLHRRILAAAVRNGHTPETFRVMCKLRALRSEQAKIRGELADYIVRACWMVTFPDFDTGAWARVQNSPPTFGRAS